jgi:hypothetical protein
MRDRLVVAALIALGVAPVIVALAAVWIWSWPWNPSDRLAAIGDALAGGTLALAFIAGVIAYVAYLAALSRPRLHLEVAFPGCGPQHPQFVIRSEEPGRSTTGLVQVQLWLENTSDYPARNPAVRVWFDPNVFGFPSGKERGWKQVGLMRLDWSNPEPIPAHGAKWNLPLLAMTEQARGSDRLADLRVELLADGYHKRWRVPVHLVNDDEAQALRPKPADYRETRIDFGPAR